MDSNSPIGVFDSGLGGLTVLKSLRRLLPHENFIFVGDSARAPYGSRTPEEIILYLQQFMDYFKSCNVKMAICACNTMTSYGYPLFKDNDSFFLVPMNPAIKPALDVTPNKHIGVIATEATIKKEMHKSAAMQIDTDIQIYSLGCPKFVPLIEAGKIEGEEIENAVFEYAKHFTNTDIQSLILGCTHYPIISNILKKYFGPEVTLINPALETAKNAVSILKANNLLNKQNQKGSLQLRFSAIQKNSTQMAKIILGNDIPPITNVDLTTFVK